MPQCTFITNHELVFEGRAVNLREVASGGLFRHAYKARSESEIEYG